MPYTTANLPDGISALLDYVLLPRELFPVVVGDEAGEGSAAAPLHILPRQLNHLRKEDIATLVVHLVETTTVTVRNGRMGMKVLTTPKWRVWLSEIVLWLPFFPGLLVCN